MAENLIKNPGFEKDWGEQSSHLCYVWRDLHMETREIGNIFTPPDYVTYFYHQPGTWDQPEVRDTRQRVHSGDKGMLLFTFYRKHEAGFLQQVEVVAGKTYELTAFAHAWSNWHDGPHPDDPRWSEGPGYDPGYLLEGEAPTDEWKNFTFKIGIDPNGGIDPYSAKWGRGAHIYNEWREVPAVKVTAKSNIITIFLDSLTLWPYKHNDAYWDDVSLVEAEEEGVCNPIIDISNCLYLPQRSRGVTPAEEDAAWETAKETYMPITRSEHEAIMLAMTGRDATITALHSEDRVEELTTFWHGYRPDVKLVFEGVEPPISGVTPYSQRDPEWRNEIYSGNCTFGEAGCYVTSVAMINSFAGYTDNPPETAEKLRNAGAFNGCYLSRAGRIPNAYPKMEWAGRDNWRTVPADLNKLRKELEKQPTIIEVDFVPATSKIDQHFLVAVEFTEDGKDLVCIDSWDGSQIKLLQRYAQSTWDLGRAILGMRKLRVKELWGDPNAPDPLPAGEARSLHIQTHVGGLSNFLRNMHDLLGIKFTSSVEDVVDAINQNPNENFIPVYRRVDNNQKPYYEDPNPTAAATRWLGHSLEALERACDAIAQAHPHRKEPYFVFESINEEYGTFMTEKTKQVVAFDAALAQVVRGTGLPIATGVYTAAVGNIHPDEFGLLLPLADVSKELGYQWVWWGPHPYYWVTRTAGGPSYPTGDGHDWYEYHAGRHFLTDDYLMERGYYVWWYGGETGAVGTSDNGHTLLATIGWRHKDCMNGDWNRYNGMIDKHIELTQKENAKRQNRHRFHCYFTVGESYVGWSEYRLSQAQFLDWVS